MRRKQNALLAGIAGIALISSLGLALAQQAPAGQGKDKPAAHTSSTSPSSQGIKPSEGGVAEQHPQSQGAMTKSGMKANPATAQGGKGNNTAAQQQGASGMQQSSANTGAKNDRSAANAQRTGKNGHEKIGMSQRSRQDRDRISQARNEHRGGRNELRSSQREGNRGRASAERRETKSSATASTERHGRTSTVARSERDSRLKGLQANTALPMSGENVRLTDQQRSTIRDTVIEGRNAPRVGHVDFDVRVGTVLPHRDVHIVPVPETLVRIEPEWRGYLYFVYEHEVVVVNPRDMRIVAVLEV